MSSYRPTIGIEVHAELKTKTKMFCRSKNDPDERRPNVNICPVCLAHPGTLPVINKAAIKHVLRVGTAIGGTLADFTEFDRKNYFYPDLPKGYQISQYEHPLVSGGELAGVTITRVHLEEDTGRSSHENTDASLVDFNRAGVPLMELVTEPVVHSAEEAGKFARELQLLLRTLGVSDANMEKGEMRVEANISVSKTDTFGTKVEVKNLNSFRSLEQAIKFETERQIELLERGEKVVQETRGWDENRGKTFSQRTKESAHDYRYFPDPDLPKLRLGEIPEFSIDELKKELPELPWEKRGRLSLLGLAPAIAEMFVASAVYGPFFDAVTVGETDKKSSVLAANYISSDLAGLAGGEDTLGKVTIANFISLMRMAIAGEISSRGAKDILAVLYKEGGDPKKIADEKGLIQKSDEGELKKIVEQIVADNKNAADEYKAGKEQALQFLVGQGMKATKGAANPSVLKKLIHEAIS
jgi:aspartyl-tRNA(Asn)/glutamyl-tRNA(Gln) amidotransferase subunit B